MKLDTAYDFFSQGEGQPHYHVIFEWVIRKINIIKLAIVHIFYKRNTSEHTVQRISMPQ